MKVALWVKLTAGFFGIIVLFGLVMTLFIRHSLDRQLSQFVASSDIQYSQEIAAMLAEELRYIEDDRAIEQRLFDELLLDPDIPPARMMGRHSRYDGLPMFHSMMHRGRSTFQKVVLTDSQGVVRNVYGPPEQQEQLPRRLTPSAGSPIEFLDDVIGYVYAGTMIDPELDQYHRQLLVSLDRSVSLAALIALAAAGVVSLVMFFHITSPVRSLRKAAAALARGDYGARAHVIRKDELGDLAHDFNEMADALQRSEQWKRQVISDSAHELRTPVALLSAEIEMMLEGVYAPDHEQLTHMQREVGQLARLINDLQTLSDVESGNTALEMQSVVIADLIKQIAAAYVPAAQREGITLTCQEMLSPEVQPVDADLSLECDPGRIEQVAGNILNNGISYTPRGGRIDLSCYIGVDGRPVVAVEDSGPGIPPDIRDAVFERFYRVEAHRGRGRGGAGLGLAISREIMRLHRGTLIAVDPLFFGGARFEMIFPQGVAHSSS